MNTVGELKVQSGPDGLKKMKLRKKAARFGIVSAVILSEVALWIILN